MTLSSSHEYRRDVPNKYVTVGGVATFVHHRGPTTLPGTPPRLAQGATVVCLHGAEATGAGFGDLLDALAARHSPVSLDLPGHGRSGNLDSLGDVGAMATHVGGTLAALGVGPAVVVGDELGAAVALQLAASQPDTVTALVLTGTETSLDATAERLRPVAAGKARREFPYRGLEGEVAKKAFMDWVKTDPRVSVGDADAWVAWSSASAAPLATVRCPTLVVSTGRVDTAAAEALAGRLPQGRHTVLSDAADPARLTAPAALAALIEEVVA